MSDRSYLSIGEVLALVQKEFPDVTISKIRFLESQGLLDPERTPSGYRKFYPADVERLRWILRQQRERFLPLKVIKDRLAEGTDPVPTVDADGEVEVEVDVRDAATPGGGRPAPASPPDPVPTTGPASDTGAPGELAGEERLPVWMTNRPASVGPLPGLAAEASGAPTAGGEPSTPTPAASGPTAPAGRTGGSGSRSSAGRGAARPARPPAAGPAATSATTGAAGSTGLGSGASLSPDELAAAVGLSVEEVARLAEYGLIRPRVSGRTTSYDEEAVVVARLAAGFARFGIEPRHLRLFRTQAEREAALFEQVVLPLLRQRNPEANARAAAAMDELGRLGDQMREAMLRHELRDYR